MLIRVDDLRGPEVAALLTEHLRCMHEHSPPESVHALDLDKLRQPEITFWTLWSGAELAGCGAIKELDSGHAEIKSMRTDYAYLRRGVAARILQHIIAEARHRGYQRLSLETGSMDYFAPAWELYSKHGFVDCGPFGDYEEDPYSRFMTLSL